MARKDPTDPALAIPKQRRKWPHLFLWLLLVLVCAGTAAVVVVSSAWLRDLPSIDGIEQYGYTQTTRVYAGDGTTLLAEFYLQDRQPVKLAEVSGTVIEATLATEDERFYDHGAIDVIGIARALVNNLTNEEGGLQGASTITQQLVRNTVLSEEATDISVKRKLREAQLALELESVYSKDEILNLYLNTINYGDNCYGIQAAARHYFQKNASELSLVEAAALVGIPQSPTAYTPTVDPDACWERRNVVLQRMLECGYIDQGTYDEAVNAPLELNAAPERSIDGIFAYPYFTSYVRDTLLENYSTQLVYEGGLTVYTTLDIGMQQKADEACAEQLSWLDGDIEASLVAIDPDNGFIKCMVGGRDFYADQYNLATQAQRQPGSSFKAFTLTTALKQGINPSTLIDASGPAQLDNWHVENWENESYGIITIQNAFAISSNTAFARLIKQVGPQNVANTAYSMGITSELDAVDSLTLGTSGVTTLEMADAYATFATGGLHRDATAITSVVDRDGNVIYEWEDQPVQALDREVACAAIKVMKTVFTQGTATSAQLYTGQEAAGKTGTSENYRDHWLVGYTPQLSCAVWIGSREERAIPGLNCNYLWQSFMSRALEGSDIEAFPTAADPTYDNPWNQTQNDTLGAILKQKEEEERKAREKAEKEAKAKAEAEKKKQSSSNN